MRNWHSIALCRDEFYIQVLFFSWPNGLKLRCMKEIPT